MFAHGSYAQLGTTLKSSDTRVQGDGLPGTKCRQRDPWKTPMAP